VGYIGFTQFYPWVKLTVLPSFTQFYPILPNWFYPLGKTYMPTLVFVFADTNDHTSGGIQYRL